MSHCVYSVEKLNDTTFRIDECGRDNCYLLLGEARALLIDCSIGAGDLRALTASLTKLPLTVAATHAHGDHIGAGYQFDAVYVPQEEITLNYRLQNTRHFRRKLLSNAMKQQGVTGKSVVGGNFKAAWLPLPDGMTFDLGGRTVRALRTPGHTAGSTVFADDTQKILFTGDSVCPVLPLNTYRCLPLSRWLPVGERLLVPAQQGYRMLCGHGNGRVSASLLAQQLEWVREILAQHPHNEKKHSRTYYPEFSAEGCVCFDEANLY